MRPLTRATTKPRPSFVPVASFEFESFEVRMRRMTRHKPLPIGVSFGSRNIHRPTRQFKTSPKPIDVAQRAKDFLPSPLLQGPGLKCLRLRARPVNRPAALSSRHCSLCAQSHERPVRRVRRGNETKFWMLVKLGASAAANPLP